MAASRINFSHALMGKNYFLKGTLAVLLRPVAAMVGAMAPRLKQVWAFTRLRAARVAVDPSVVVLEMPELHGTHNIRLGRNLYLYSGLYLETRDGGSIVLGDDVVISRGVHLVSHAGISIGAGSMIGEYTSVRDANHRFGAGLQIRESGYDARPIRIGRNVWIGRGVTVLPGVNIGDHAVVAANAVVSRDVAPHAIVGGIPARPLRPAKQAAGEVSS
jgi:acetyltransferase-like isoleucine patch superfamily enzyme